MTERRRSRRVAADGEDAREARRVTQRRATGDPSEWRQAIDRLLVVSGTLAYLGAAELSGFAAADVRSALVLTGCYLGAAMVDVASFTVVPGPSRMRRVLMLGGDLCVTTLGAHVGGEWTAPLVAVYVWIVVGHGVRYGERYLLASGLAGMVAFGWVVAATPYWRVNLLLGAGHLAGIVIVTVLVFSLLRRTRLAAERAARTVRANSRFATDLSHEFRTALSSISGLADVLTRADLDRASAEHVRLINAASDTLLSLSDDILDLARLEAGRFTVACQPVNVYELLFRVVDTVRPLARQKSLALGVTVSMQLPPVVGTDGRRLTQILLNLLGNAVKYTASGGVRLALEGGPGMLRFEVRDSGPGIPVSLKGEMLFRRFIRAAEHESGTGLGLAIAKDLVERLGGEIGACALPAGGTRFWFTVPCESVGVREPPSVRGRVLHIAAEGTAAGGWAAFAEPLELVSVSPREIERTLAASDLDQLLAIVARKAAELPAELLTGPLAGAAREGVPIVLEGAADVIPPDGSAAGIWGWTEDLGASARAIGLLAHARRRACGYIPPEPGEGSLAVLVAEDEPIAELFLRATLERLRCRVESVGDGPSAVRAARAKRWDLILVDNRLPGFGAISVIEALRDMHVPVVVVSADATEEARAAAMRAGAVDYVVKPVTAPRLASLLRAHATHATRPGRTASCTGEDAQDRAVATAQGPAGGSTAGSARSAACGPASTPRP